MKRQLLRDSPSSDDIQFVHQLVIPRLLVVLDRCDDIYRKKFSVIVVLALIFLVLDRMSISSITFSGVVIDDLNPVKKLIPVVIAYSFSEILSVSALRRACLVTLHNCANRNNGGLDIALFSTLVQPPSHLVASAFLVDELSGWVRGVYRIGAAVELLGLLLSPPVLLAYAYYGLFATFGSDDWVVVISSFLSFVFVANAILAYWTGGKLDNDSVVAP